jgi:putative heme-binding domain-containing protein
MPIHRIIPVALLVSAFGTVVAQTEQIHNQYTTPADVKAGAEVFRVDCARCHGLDGTGGIGPDLTRGRFRHGGGDAALLKTIFNGISGTEMPGLFGGEVQVWRVIAYLRTLQPKPGNDILPGNPERGRQLFRGKGGCQHCHMVDGEGGRLGPDLSDIGGARVPRFLRTSVLDPDAKVDPRYHLIHVVKRDGKTLVGFRLNEDAYSMQLLDTSENLRSLMKIEISLIREESTSSMPSYQGRLSGKEIDDVVAYLYSLRKKDVE